MRTLHLAAFLKHSLRDWSGIPRPPGLESLAASRAQLAPGSSDVRLPNNHLLVLPAARGTVRAPKVISLFETLESADNTTIQTGDWNGLPPLDIVQKKTPR